MFFVLDSHINSDKYTQMTRIALCFAGEARLWEHGYQQICFCKELFPESEIDVFIHTWNNITYKRSLVTQSVSSSLSAKSNIDQDNIDHSLFIDTYQPKSYKIEHKDILDPIIQEIEYYDRRRKAKLIELADLVKHTGYTGISQMYSTGAVHKLRMEYEEQNNIEYDVILHTRTDIELKLLFDPSRSSSWLEAVGEKIVKHFRRKQDLVRFPDCRVYSHDTKKSKNFCRTDHNIWWAHSFAMNKIFSKWSIKELSMCDIKDRNQIRMAKTEQLYPYFILHMCNLRLISPLLGGITNRAHLTYTLRTTAKTRADVKPV